MYFSYYQSPYGQIALTANDQGLTALAFMDSAAAITIPEHFSESPAVFERCKQQLEQYFNGQRQTFDLALAPQGTNFQKLVWQALTQIPQGETKSYSWLAKKISKPKAVRAVGAANGANPIALIIPCHRVIGSNGKLTGYAGGLALKSKLLMHEGAQFRV